MTIEERRAELVAFVENEYGGQEVLKLADAYALEVVREALVIAWGYARGWGYARDGSVQTELGKVRNRIEALR